MEKSLGLCVCWFVRNYGSVLQSYATTVTLDDLRVPYEVLRYHKKISPGYILKSLPFVMNPVFLDGFRLKLRKARALRRFPEFAENSAIRDRAFERFVNEKFLHMSPPCFGYGALKKYATKFAACMTGSDQVWRPAGVATNFFNLLFAGDGVTKIAYASSFGARKIPARWAETEDGVFPAAF